MIGSDDCDERLVHEGRSGTHIVIHRRATREFFGCASYQGDALSSPCGAGGGGGGGGGVVVSIANHLVE